MVISLRKPYIQLILRWVLPFEVPETLGELSAHPPSSTKSLMLYQNLTRFWGFPCRWSFMSLCIRPLRYLFAPFACSAFVCSFYSTVCWLLLFNLWFSHKFSGTYMNQISCTASAHQLLCMKWRDAQLYSFIGTRMPARCREGVLIAHCSIRDPWFQDKYINRHPLPCRYNCRQMDPYTDYTA